MRYARYLAVVVCLGLGLAQAQESVNRVWDKAMAALGEKRFDLARVALQEYEQRKPGTLEAPYAMAVVCWNEVFDAVSHAAKVGKTAAGQRQKWGATLTEGHAQAARALIIDPFHSDTLCYDSLLYRLEAELAESPGAARELIARADARLKEAQVARDTHPQRKTNGLRLPPPPPPPPEPPGPPPPPPPPPPPVKR